MENKILNLKLHEYKNSLDGIICYEDIDNNKLDLLLNSSLLKKDNYNNKLYDNEKNHLMKYKKLFKDGKY